MADHADMTTIFSLRLDTKTVEFLHNLRDQEHVNLSAWVRDAIQRKADLGRKPKSRKRGSYLE